MCFQSWLLPGQVVVESLLHVWPGPRRYGSHAAIQPWFCPEEQGVLLGELYYQDVIGDWHTALSYDLS